MFWSNRANEFKKMVAVLRKLEFKRDVPDTLTETTRYTKLRRELMLEKDDSETAQDEPVLEAARELALVIDAFNSLSHIHDASRRRGNLSALSSQIRAGKDLCMEKLAMICLGDEGLEHGLRCGIGADSEQRTTMEVDIPGVGHLSWHFGKEANVVGFKMDMAHYMIEKDLLDIDPAKRSVFIEGACKSKDFLRYTQPTEERVINGQTYGNSNLLCGIKLDRVNSIDFRLITFDNVESYSPTPATRAKLYGVDNVLSRISRNPQDTFHNLTNR